MPESREPEARLWVAIHEGLGFVRVVGRGSYQVSAALKDFGVSAVEQGAEGLVLDLRECSSMDSTFMGVIAGLAMRLRRLQGEAGRVVMLHLSAKTMGLLSTLGLDQLVDAYETDEGPEALRALLGAGLAEQGQRVSDEAPGRTLQLETMLAAHEDLVRAAPENLPRFKDVIEFLRGDVRRDRGAPDAPSA